MLNSVAPNMVTFTRSATAASELFLLIDRVSDINPFDTAGAKPAQFDASIDIRNLTFNYPTRPHATVLDDFSLHIPAGKVTALVVSFSSENTGWTVISHRNHTLGRQRFGQEHNYRASVQP